MKPVTPRFFRALLLASVLIGLAASTVDWLWPALLPLEWQLLWDETPLPWMPEGDFWWWLLMLVLGACVLMLSVAAVAMCFFKPWARSLSLWGTALVMPVVVWLGPTMYSGLSGALLELSSMLWGAALALAYFSPLAQRFART